MGDDPLKSYFAFVRRRLAQPERPNLDPARRILIGAVKKPRGRLVPSIDLDSCRTLRRAAAGLNCRTAHEGNSHSTCCPLEARRSSRRPARPYQGTAHPAQSRRRRGAEIPMDGRGAARQSLRFPSRSDGPPGGRGERAVTPRFVLLGRGPRAREGKMAVRKSAMRTTTLAMSEKTE